MIVIFCSDPFDTTHVDADYMTEYETVVELGAKPELISYEALVSFDNAIQATKTIKKLEQIEDAIYRGWMMKPYYYDKLFQALLQKNIRLLNTLDAYTHCHYLPYTYDIIKEKTPTSVWCSVHEYKDNFHLLKDKLSIFEGKAIIVKDYVKSRKHEWHDACYINSSSDEEELKRVTNNFITRQAETLNEGLVFREFIELEFLTNHSKSNMPLTKEFRIFVLHKKPICIFKYWDEGDYNHEIVPIEEYEEIIRSIDSNFYTLDIAKRKDGKWIIIEVGDGQVSGLPDNANIKNFYNEIIIGWK